MRVVEKTKRRQRKVRRMKHKGRFTVLRVREVRVLGGEGEESEGGLEGEEEEGEGGGDVEGLGK